MTIADPKPLFADARVFFDHIIRQSLAGAYPAMNEFGTCQYRTADGRKCVMGDCIPDAVYVARMDSTGNVLDLLSSYPKLSVYIPAGMTVDDMRFAQKAHDYFGGTNGEPWDHAVFLDKLRDVPAFAPFFAELDAAAGKVQV